MSQIPWWGLPLIAVVFALAGAVTAQLVTARDEYARSRRKATRRWYEERKDAYVALLSVFERDTYRLRAAYDAGDKPPSALAYVDDVAPALMRVRLLASGPVRSAALAVHLLLQKLHGEMNPAAVSGVQPQTHFRELLTQVPLVMQQFEEAVREELRMTATPPTKPELSDADRPRSWRRRSARTSALDDLENIGQDLSRDRSEPR
ncbi:hypothetical protein GCM10010172_42610 [Paractinoplanes ferrugineus]|uniref:Uncharacterized protein n=1 Tax=Paractinoplanes ferrugineus TaxID=113564 RepID=A0A919J6C1_9ACTN|nr:hypothetical protein [Actinoplanes ferrugineus]GIE13419.1 hypothetical protein Afe05nite_52590 [Actinoplanes ferrugineus]